eukprot:GHVS01021423.1.p1 GENE.GHVS01021423.1~~GHVS01021423.1.p1  ORF type:complete len:165 (+),score=9.21 GHVS01021423.1:118-612(+)
MLSLPVIAMSSEPYDVPPIAEASSSIFPYVAIGVDEGIDTVDPPPPTSACQACGGPLWEQIRPAPYHRCDECNRLGIPHVICLSSWRRERNRRLNPDDVTSEESDDSLDSDDNTDDESVDEDENDVYRRIQKIGQYAKRSRPDVVEAYEQENIKQGNQIGNNHN